MDNTKTKIVPLPNKQTMEHNKGAYGFICGIMGWVGYNIAFEVPSSILNIIQAGITAFICGVLGAAGKWLFDVLKNKFFNSKQ